MWIGMKKTGINGFTKNLQKHGYYKTECTRKSKLQTEHFLHACIHIQSCYFHTKLIIVNNFWFSWVIDILRINECHIFCIFSINDTNKWTKNTPASCDVSGVIAVDVKDADTLPVE